MTTPTKRKSPDEVHRNMSAIRSTDTRIEIIVRSELWRAGYRFRKNDKRLPGRPDIVFASSRLAVFCDSDYWHGRDWESLQQRLTTNPEYWIPKIQRNRERDKQINDLLRDTGWTVLRFWESDIKKNLTAIIQEIAQHIDEGKKLSTHLTNSLT